jgi:septal ring factor EnvC (AmiA/AmiB activator)
MKKQLIAGGAGLAGVALAAFAVWQFQELMHVRWQLAESQAQIQTANASASAARTQLDAIRKELDERKLDFDQMRAERDSAKVLLEAEKQHTERIHAELNLAREQLALFARARSEPAPRAVAAPGSRGRAIAAPMPALAPIGR